MTEPGGGGGMRPALPVTETVYSRTAVGAPDGAGTSPNVWILQEESGFGAKA